MVSDQPDLKVTAIKTVSKYTTQQQESANTHTVNATDTHKIDNTRHERGPCTKQNTHSNNICTTYKRLYNVNNTAAWPPLALQNVLAKTSQQQFNSKRTC